MESRNFNAYDPSGQDEFTNYEGPRKRNSRVGLIISLIISVVVNILLWRALKEFRETAYGLELKGKDSNQ